MRTGRCTDDRARAAIKSRRQADDSTRSRRVIERLGFDRDEADVRAKILFYAGDGFGDVGPIGDRSEPARQLETLVEFLTTR